ncbi:MAG: LamB/YcsF family protein [Nocardioides sp.]
MKTSVDLNADLGEEVTDDVGLLQVVTSANVACGYHAGNLVVMRKVCDLAAASAVVVGAQVSYADRENFGRVSLRVDSSILREQVADQVGTLSAIAVSAGTTVSYLKPHGALYHRTLWDEDQAAAVAAGSGALPVLGMAGELTRIVAGAGRRVVSEGFPDRGYGADGLLLDRNTPGAVLTDTGAITTQAVRLADSVESLCLHGDTPGAVVHADAVRKRLIAAGWTLTAFCPGTGT